MVEIGSEPLLSALKKTTSKYPALDVRWLEREMGFFALDYRLPISWAVRQDSRDDPPQSGRYRGRDCCVI